MKRTLAAAMFCIAFVVLVSGNLDGRGGQQSEDAEPCAGWGGSVSSGGLLREQGRRGC